MNYICNPMNLPYQYQIFERNGKYYANREAADPSLILFQGLYYLFPSMAGGFYTSKDLRDWEYHELGPEIPIYDYAPDVRVMGDYMYFSASKRFENCDFYRTKDPLHGPFEVIKGTFPFWDPNLFIDDDGRVYFYWGCSNQTPIYGCELDPKTMLPLGEKKELIFGNDADHGFERIGPDHYNVKTPEMIEEGMQNMVIHMFEGYTDYHDLPQDKQDFLRAFISSTAPFIEGAWMTKHEGTYYLQYASPATETNTYNDGVYVGKSPLGPFTPAKNNPYSYHPGGFMTGAGHGSTLEDQEGRFWHVSSMHISNNHDMERRLGLWRAGFDQDGDLYCDQYLGDWPRRFDAEPFTKPEWMLLSYGKNVEVSGGTGAENLTDENAKTVWKAETEEATAVVDLGAEKTVHAIQVNFMDDALEVVCPENAYFSEDRTIDHSRHVTGYRLLGSTDKEHWTVLADRSNTKLDLPHELFVEEQGWQIRYVKIEVVEMPFHGPACMSGFRIFGKSNMPLPEKTEYTIHPISDLDVMVSWPENKEVQHVISWGYTPEKLYHSYTVIGKKEQKIGAVIRGQDMYFRVDAWNEGGITEGEVKKL